MVKMGFFGWKFFWKIECRYLIIFSIVEFFFKNIRAPYSAIRECRVLLSLFLFSQSEETFFFVNFFNFVGMPDWIQVDCFCKQLFGWIWPINPYVDMLFLDQHRIPSLVGNNWYQQCQTSKNEIIFFLNGMKYPRW